MLVAIIDIINGYYICYLTPTSSISILLVFSTQRRRAAETLEIMREREYIAIDALALGHRGARTAQAPTFVLSRVRRDHPDDNFLFSCLTFSVYLSTVRSALATLDTSRIHTSISFNTHTLHLSE